MTIWVGQDGTLNDDQGDGAVDGTAVTSPTTVVVNPPATVDTGTDDAGGDDGGGNDGGDGGDGGDGAGDGGGDDQGQQQQQQQQQHRHHKKHGHHGRHHGKHHGGKHHPSKKLISSIAKYNATHGEFSVVGYDAYGTPYGYYVGADDDGAGDVDDAVDDADDGTSDDDADQTVQQPVVVEQVFQQPSVVYERPGRSWFTRFIDRFRSPQRLAPQYMRRSRGLRAFGGACPPGYLRDGYGRCVYDLIERDLHRRYAHLHPFDRDRAIGAERLRLRHHLPAALPAPPLHPIAHTFPPVPPMPPPPAHATHGHFAGWYPFTSWDGSLFAEGAGQYQVYDIDRPWDPPFEGEEAAPYPPDDEEEEERERMLDQADLDTQLRETEVAGDFDPTPPLPAPMCGLGMIWDAARAACVPLLTPPTSTPVSTLHQTGFDMPLTDSWGNLLTAPHPAHIDYPAPPPFGHPVMTGWMEPFTDLEGHLLGGGPGEYGHFLVANPHDHRLWDNVDFQRLDPEGLSMYRTVVGQDTDWGAALGQALGGLAQGAASALGGSSGGSSGSALGSGDLGASLSNAFGSAGGDGTGGSSIGAVFGQIASTAAKVAIPVLAKAGTRALSQAMQQKPQTPPPPATRQAPVRQPARVPHPAARPRVPAHPVARHPMQRQQTQASLDQLQQFMTQTMQQGTPPGGTT